MSPTDDAFAGPLDWTELRINEAVTVVEPHGHTYEAFVENKTRDSAVIWIRRADIGSSHLLERHDGILIVSRTGVTRAASG